MTKPIIGSALKDCDKIQRSVRKDPHPEIIFQEDSLFSDRDILWAVITIVCLIIVVLTGIAYS